MPKFPKGFGRRKSTPNALEELTNAPATTESSFRVIDRTHTGNKSFDGGVKLARGAGKGNTSPVSNKDNIFEDLKGSRGSGGSNTNTVSTTDNSSRLSAASTAPSSTDLHNHGESRTHNQPPPKTTGGFSLKAAGRTFSFGRAKAAATSPTTVHDEMPSPPPTALRDESARPRAVPLKSSTGITMASKTDDQELGLSLGGDFADMFSSFGNRRSRVMEVEGIRTMSQSPDYTPAAASRPLIANRSNQPSPLHIDGSKEVESAPYSWTSHNSDDRLLNNPNPLHERNPPVPRHGSPFGRIDGPVSRPLPAETGVRRSSALAVRRQSTLEYGDTVDEDAQLLRDSINASRRIANEPRVRDSWLPSSNTPQNGESPGTSNWKGGSGSAEATPRPAKATLDEDNMFEHHVDHHIAASADLAERYHQKPVSPPKGKAMANKVMTPAQFERYRQEQERLKNFGGKQDNEDNEDDTYDDDEDEAEKQKQLAKQRRKQEAHMSVYRQQMMKVTGDPSPRQSIAPFMSTPDLQLLGQVGEDGEEEDEEIPLAILAAHGFPNKNRPPVRLSAMSSNPNLRAANQLGSYPAPPKSTTGESLAAGSRGSLPVFARNLPQDPYFGAGLVNPSNRESLALGGGAGSAYGAPRGLPPGGLVGVIATEERSRAMRRGSPNAAGEFGHPPNAYNGYGIPPVNGQVMGPMGPMTPGEQASFAMAAQMQQFMQMQMQWMQSISAGGQPAPPQLPSMPRSQTMGSVSQPVGNAQLPQLGTPHQRAMSSLDPNAAPWQNHQQQSQRNTMFAPLTLGSGYAPSIAPSERSNVGMPGRYRPVSQNPIADHSRSNTMSGGLDGWSPDNRASTIKVVKKSAEVEEDDESGWEAMKQKREKKKSIWRSKKDLTSLKEMAGYTN